MKHTATIAIVLATLWMSAPATAQTQSQGLTRAQVVMERDAFLATHRFNEFTNEWVLKSGMPMPTGVLSRAEVIAMRDTFLSMNRWDERNNTWVPVQNAPRDMSKLSREQVEMETIQFLMMHRFDESSNQWISKMRSARG